MSGQCSNEVPPPERGDSDSPEIDSGEPGRTLSFVASAHGGPADISERVGDYLRQRLGRA